MYHLPIRVSQDLYLYMSYVIEVFLNQQRVIPEGVPRFSLSRVDAVLQLRFVSDHPHAFATPSCACFQQHRESLKKAIRDTPVEELESSTDFAGFANQGFYVLLLSIVARD